MIDNARKRGFTGTVTELVGLRSRDDDFSLELLLALLALLADVERRLVSARTSSRLTLSLEKGVSQTSRISTNFEDVIVVECWSLFD